MASTNERMFGHDDRQRIYEYVERHGAADPTRVQETLAIDPRGFRHHVAILERDGRLERIDGKLRVTFDAGTEEEHQAEKFEFAIRPARQEDLTGIIGAIRHVAEEKTYIVAESVADEIDHQDALLRLNDVEARMFFVATVDEDVVGWVHLRGFELEKLSHTAELTVGVIEEYRQHGIGSQLLARGLGWARTNGYEKVYNSIPSTNEEAITFLESHGWEIEAVRDDHYKLDDEYVDEVMMAITLDPTQRE